ncbi:MAG TPA: hypothetical protein VNN73_23395 [Blastocatellia bacterium]|nr:hypothetical protein [Blastocatellia bacterium]
MKVSKNTFKISLNLLLAVAVATVFSFSTLAALEDSAKKEASEPSVPAVLQAPTGTLTSTKGPVDLNGVPAKDGATVLTGSLIYTGTGGRAIVEIPGLGRVEYGQNTEGVLTMSDKRIDATLNKCGSITMTLQAGVNGTIKILHMSDVGVFSERREVDVRVFRGQATVKRLQNKENTLEPGDHKEFDDAIEATSAGDSVFKVYCREDHPIALFFIPAFGLALIPFGGEESTAPPVLSPLAP